jgi:hypothetical protein
MQVVNGRGCRLEIPRKTTNASITVAVLQPSFETGNSRTYVEMVTSARQ